MANIWRSCENNGRPLPCDHESTITVPLTTAARGASRWAWRPVPAVLTSQETRQPRRPRLTRADRVLLAALLSVIPKARHQGLRLLVTPDTMVRWHRDIVRRHWASRSLCGRTGRPAARRNIKTLVLRLARENPDWGTAGSTVSLPAWE